MHERNREVWSGASGNGPAAGDPGLVVGGGTDAAFERAARFADGWIAGASGPDAFAEGAEKVGAAWGAAGRDGKPRLGSLAYFSLGPDAEAAAAGYLGEYYRLLGEEIAGMIVAGAATDADGGGAAISAIEAAGCDELVLCPCSGDPGQVDLLAEVAGVRPI
jgi:alkanesulfonate monooxygenase SsuD/methylene tetrahydromethanopterin reductase-like flavin-dependent oxidoreductase (luciferase family)